MMHGIPCRNGHRARSRRGAALILGLVISIALLVVIYAIYTSALFGPSTVLRTGSGVAEDRPWLEEDRIVPFGQMIELPRPPRMQIDKPDTINARVFREGEPRGQLSILLSPRGEVICTWHAEFAHGQRETTFDATAEGNIDVSKTYEGTDGPDATLLYFITKGTYTEQVYDRGTTRGFVSGGTVYVTGWLPPDGRGHGKITLTTDKKSSVSYEWKY